MPLPLVFWAGALVALAPAGCCAAVLLVAAPSADGAAGASSTVRAAAASAMTSHHTCCCSSPSPAAQARLNFCLLSKVMLGGEAATVTAEAKPRVQTASISADPSTTASGG
jgi:hypothetical protein